MRRVTWTGLIASIVVAMLLAGVSALTTASATNYVLGNGNTGCNALNAADNRDHTFSYEALRSDVQAAVTWARVNVIDPTVINTSLVSQTSATDAIIRNADYTDYCGFDWHPPLSGVWGLTTCNSTNSQSECESHSIRFDLSYFDFASQTNERGLAVHEIGHSLLLKHRDTEGSAMKTTGPYPTFLSSHDISHLSLLG